MTKEVSVREIIGDLLDINPIVNVGTTKTPLSVVDASWLIGVYTKSIGKRPAALDEDYLEFYDKFVDEYNATGDVELALEKIL